MCVLDARRSFEHSEDINPHLSIKLKRRVHVLGTIGDCKICLSIAAGVSDRKTRILQIELFP